MTDNARDDQTDHSNAIKDPKDWVTGEEPMTEAQSSFLRSLSERAGVDFDDQLNKGAASARIDELLEQTRQGGDAAENEGRAATDPTDGDVPERAQVEKDPKDWVTGGEPMTGAQASYLKTLSEEAGEEVNDQMTKGEASQRIEELQEKTGRGTT